MNKKIEGIGSYINPKWCLVDVDGFFTYLDNKFKIADDVKEYKVYNKYSEREDYTNESYMDKILSLTTDDGETSFYNQNYKQIPTNKIVKI